MHLLGRLALPSLVLGLVAFVHGGTATTLDSGCYRYGLDPVVEHQGPFQAAAPLFERIVLRLIKVRPPSVPLVVRIGTCPTDLMGYTTENAAGLEIVVSEDLDSLLQVEVLVHEWAHMLLWGISEPEHRGHGPLWGVSYANAYRAAMWEGQ